MRAPARLLALAILASMTAMLPSPATASAAEALTREGSEAVKYEGTFTGDLTWRHRVEYGGANHRTASADITVISTMPTVTFAGGMVTSAGTLGSVTVWGQGETVTVTDEGGHTSSCEGEYVSPATNAGSFIAPVGGKTTFYAFTSLSLVENCTATGDPEPSTTVVALSAIPVPVTVPRGAFGNARIDIPIDRTLTKEKCLGYERLSTTCTYQLKGVLTFRKSRVMEPFEPPTRPAWKPKANKITVNTGCAAACTVTLEVKPIRGPGRADTKAKLRPRAGKTLTIRPGAQLRKAIGRSGGVRLKVTYRSGQLSKTYTRTVRS